MILKNATNVDEAYEFINYRLDAKNSAKASNKTMAPTPNLAAFEYLDPKLKNNTMLFPPEESLKSVHIKRPYDLSGQKKLTRMWMRIKSVK